MLGSHSEILNIGGIMRFAIICAILLFVSCQPTPPPEMTDAQRTAIENIVKQQAEEYCASLAALDADRAMVHFAKDDFSYVGHGVQSFVYPSYEAMSDHIHDAMSSLREAQLGWDQIRVYVLSQNAAVFHGKFHALYTFKDGNTLNVPEGFWTALHERHDGEWKIVFVHASGRSLSTERE